MSQLDLYGEVVQCPLKCEGIVNDRALGLIPRSFYWGPQVSTVPMLIVSKNPAHAPDWEAAVYRDTPAERLAQVHYDITHEVFGGHRPFVTSYHANLVRRVAAVLGVDATAKAVFELAAMTALAKCQSAGAKTGKIPDRTFSACAERFLFRELELFQPVYLLALGKEPYDFLVDPGIARRHGLPVGKLWHPSWTNMRGGEAAYINDELPRLREQFLAAVRAAGRSLKVQ